MMLRRKKFWVWFAIALWYPPLAFICLVIFEMLADPYLVETQGPHQRPHRPLSPASNPAIVKPRVLGRVGGPARGADPFAFPLLPARGDPSAAARRSRASRNRTRYSAHSPRRGTRSSIGEAGSANRPTLLGYF